MLSVLSVAATDDNPGSEAEVSSTEEAGADVSALSTEEELLLQEKNLDESTGSTDETGVDSEDATAEVTPEVASEVDSEVTPDDGRPETS